MVVLLFEAAPIGGTLGISDETSEYGYFSRDEIESMDIMETNRDRLADAFAFQEATFVR